MSEKKPLILVTNDDSVHAKGIRCLVEVAKSFGEVIVVAPDKPQSGMGHAVTIDQILRLKQTNAIAGATTYACSGTPVDCVKLAIYEVLHQRPAILLSGINHGGNQASNVLYSGTMSAAVEGAMEGIPSIGFSLLDFNPDADFSASQMVVEKVLENAFNNEFPPNICLNVNIPKVDKTALKGIKICTQANTNWEDCFEKRIDTNGNPYYWMAGEFKLNKTDENSDVFALKNNFASVVPTQFDLTAYKAINQLEKWKLS